MSIPAEFLPTTCDVYRPFGAGSATHTNVPCQLVSDMPHGRPAGSGGLFWTHYLVLQPEADVLDGCTRVAGTMGITYADGDEVRVPSGASSPRFAVIWVESVDVGTPREFKRAYLMRHTA
jgi:hypothetical protein